LAGLLGLEPGGDRLVCVGCAYPVTQRPGEMER
jgi:hypothetical protein